MEQFKALIKKNFLLNIRKRKELCSEVIFILLSTIIICYAGKLFYLPKFHKKLYF